MSLYIKILLSLCLLHFCFNAAAQGSPFKPFSAQYDVLHNGNHVAITTLSLARHSESTWLYSRTSEAVGWISHILSGKITEQSIFNWNNGMQILSYHYDRNRDEKRVRLKFDWRNMKVINDINGDPWKMALSPGTFDKLSANLALAVHLSSGKTSVHLPVADGGKLKIYDFNIIGEEPIDTPMGKIKTMKISRNKRGREDRQAWLWLASELNHVIIKVEKYDGSDRLFSMIIKSLEQE